MHLMLVKCETTPEIAENYKNYVSNITENCIKGLFLL